jgi:hypothetical protein
MVSAILKQRKDKSVLSTGNMSVRDALRKRVDEANLVILKELSSMIAHGKIIRTFLRLLNNCAAFQFCRQSHTVGFGDTGREKLFGI